jgi:hypothetical protein
MGPPILSYKILQDTPALVRSIGRLFQPPRHIRKITARVLYGLKEKLGLSVDSSLSGVLPSAYNGAHLRTEHDTTVAGMMRCNVQAPFYLKAAVAANLTSICAAPRT